MFTDRARIYRPAVLGLCIAYYFLPPAPEKLLTTDVIDKGFCGGGQGWGARAAATAKSPAEARAPTAAVMISPGRLVPGLRARSTAVGLRRCYGAPARATAWRTASSGWKPRRAA